MSTFMVRQGFSLEDLQIKSDPGRILHLIYEGWEWDIEKEGVKTSRYLLGKIEKTKNHV